MKKFTLIFSLLCIYYSGFSQINDNSGKPNFESSNIKPKSIIEKGKGHYVIDFGKDAFGTLSLIFKSSQPDSLVIHLGEMVTDKGIINRNPGGTIRYQKIVLSEIPVNKQFQLKLTPDKRNSQFPAVILPDSFGIIMPFRYCEFENLNIPIKDVEVSQKVYNYRFNDEASYFTSSDTVLNKVWEMCKHTIKATSFCGLYIDGDRERIPYEADAFINQLSHYCVDNEYTLARRTNEYFINHATWPTEWILHTVLLFYYDYLYTGNTELISKYYDALRNKTLIQLETADGLISTTSPQLTVDLMTEIGLSNNTIKDIVDWPVGERDGYDMVGVNTVVNSFYYINLKLMSDIAGVLGKKEDSVFFYNKSLQVKNTINTKLLNQTTGIYIDGEGSTHSSLHANMFPLAFGIVPGENIPKVVSFIKSRGMACSVYGAQYLLESLYLNNEADYALSLMNSTEGDRNWWNMIRFGSTMTLEAWDIKYKPNLDMNHAWGTAPANIITRYMWGINPSRPGFEKVMVKPQMSNLTFSKIKVPTLKGPIYAEYKKLTDKRKLYIINLPIGMEGEFMLTNSDNSKIVLNKRRVKSNRGLVPLTQGINRIEIIN